MRAINRILFVWKKRFNRVIYKSEDNSSVIISSPKTIEEQLKEHNLEDIGKHVYDMYSSDFSLEDMAEDLKLYHLIGFESVRVDVIKYKRFNPSATIIVMVR